MKKFLSVLSVLLVVFIISACSEKQSKEKDTNEKQSEVEASTTIEENSTEDESSSTEEESELEDKEEYNQIFSIFLDKAMEESFRKLVGEDLDIFRVTFQQISPIPTEDENQFAFHGYMPGLEGVAEGVVIFDNSGNMWAAASEGENVNLYTDNDEKHHPIIEDWRQTFFSGSAIVYK